jgi:hypothetical protein
MSNKANQASVRDEEVETGKVKPFRTSSRLKLPPREEKPEDDSVYDRFLGALEQDETAGSVNIEEARVEAKHPAEVLPSAASQPEPLRQQPAAQSTRSHALEREERAVPKLQAAVSPAADKDFDTEQFIREVSRVYRLNAGESAVLRSLLEMSHALKVDECEVTVPKIMARTSLSEQRVRRNLKSLRGKGWIRLVREFNPFTHAPAVYKVFLRPS